MAIPGSGVKFQTLVKLSKTCVQDNPFLYGTDMITKPGPGDIYSGYDRAQEILWLKNT